MKNYVSCRLWLCKTLLITSLLVSYMAFSQERESKENLLLQLQQTQADSPQRIPVLVKLVQACWRACAPEAKEFGREALALLDKWPDSDEESTLLVYMPRMYQRDGLHDEAQALVDRGLKTARENGNVRKLASIQFNQAILYSDKKQFILAENAYQQLYKTYKEIDYANGLGSTLNNLGFISSRLHNYGKALEQYQEALAIYEQDGVLYNAANTLGNIGNVYLSLGDYAMAEQSIRRGLDMVTVEQYPGIYATVTSRLADVLIATRQFEEASKLILQILAISGQSQIRLADPEMYAKLANIALLQNDLEQAEEYYQMGLASYSEQSLDDSYMSLNEVAAKIKTAQNKLSEAEAFLVDVVPSIQAGDISDSALTMLKQLIEVKKLQGSWQQSAELLSLYQEKFQEQVESNRESRLEQFNILYKANQQERLIVELEQENSLKSIQVLTEQAARRQVIFISLLIAIFLFVVIYIGMQKRNMLSMRAQLLQDETDKKTRLFSDISHELRTPLSVLKLQIEGLEHDLVDDPKQTYQLLHAKLASINHLISDISQLAQADAGDLALGFEPVYVRAFFKQWCMGAASLAKEKGLDFSYKINLSAEDRCYMDPERIKQVLNNLLSNSCRYTDAPGRIEFKARIHNRTLQWLIQDSAPGLSQEQMEQIFERLYRVDKSRSRKSGGSGLGLSICKTLVETHHGSIGAEPSELGGLCIKVSHHLSGRRRNRG